MMVFDKLISCFKEHFYLLTFFGTLFDNSGLPTFITLAGSFAGMKKVNQYISLSISYLALVCGDFLLYGAGIFLKKLLKNSEKQLTQFLKKLIEANCEIFKRNEWLFYLFCKIIAWIGKIAPLLAAYSGKDFSCIIKFLFGDLWYCLTFFYAAYAMGTLAEHKLPFFIISIAMFFLTLYGAKSALRKFLKEH
jgi:membrane-associated protein